MRDAGVAAPSRMRAAVTASVRVERRAGGSCGDDDEIAAVELRDEAARRLAEFVEAEGDNAGIDDEHDRGEAHELAR